MDELVFDEELLRQQAQQVSNNKMQAEIIRAQILDNKSSATWFENVALEGRNARLKIDSGSGVDALPFTLYQTLRFPEARMEPVLPFQRLRLYSGHELAIFGTAEITTKLRGCTVRARFYILDGEVTPVIGYQTGLALSLFSTKKEYEPGEIWQRSLIELM